MRSQVYIYPFITLFQKVIIMNCIKEQKKYPNTVLFSKKLFQLYILYVW